ncbi:MAG: phenylacetate--CoA ligase family protein [Gemmatimonadaceae bacterium]|nr:phenylacetate--CoA ligase family protein [Gemmatimonadaceae bacterium]
MTGRELVSRGVIAALDTVRSLRPSMREGERHFADGLQFRRRTLSWSDEQKHAWQLQRLRDIVRRAAEDSAFYRARLSAAGLDPRADFSFRDFARLPALDRDDVAANINAMVSPRVAPSLRRRDSTGGSTGVPLAYFSGPRERGWRLSGIEHFMERLGVPRWVSTAFLWGHHIDARERTQWREQLREVLTAQTWYDCFRLSPDLLLRYHASMERQAPTCLVAYASALDALASTLLANGLTAHYPTRRIVTGAEKLWPQQRARVEQAFSAPVHERYGSREIGLIGMQLDPRVSLAFDIDWANVLVEPADDGDDAEILVTKLQADAMPMLRYRIGDVARFAAGEGRDGGALRLVHILGRKVDRLYHPDGRWLDGHGAVHLMKDFPLREFQIRQDADYGVEIQVVPAEGYGAAHGERIVAVLRQNLPGLSMHVTTVDAIARTSASKWRPVLSHAPESNRAQQDKQLAPEHVA